MFKNISRFKKMSFVTVMTILCGGYALAQDVEGLETSKKVADNGDGTYTITMETYTTGEVKSEDIAIPLDIVLVLDQSGSMAEIFDDSGTRQAALKNALNNFITEVNAKYTKEADHRVSLITFGDDPYLLSDWTTVDGNGKKALRDKINSLPDSPEGSTETDEGLVKAESQFSPSNYKYNGTNLNRQRVVILFTDGVPTSHYYWDSFFSTGTANLAIASANRLKTDNVMVYSVGIQGGSDPNIYDLIINHNYNCYDDDDNGKLSNRFLNYLSGNFTPTAAPNMGGTSDEDAWHVYYTPTVNYPRSKDNFYLTANNAVDLNNIFQKIIQEIVVPTISLGPETVMKDTASPFFDLPSDVSKIGLYFADYNGSTFGTRYIADSSVIPIISGNSLTVTGFDFDANVCTDKPHPDGKHGKKLIIEFKITPKTGFLGGNGVKTNDRNNSGVISKDNELIENYEEDYGEGKDGVDVPLLEFLLRVSETNVYENDDYGEDILAKLEISTDGGITYTPFETWINSLEDWEKAYVKDIIPVLKEENRKLTVELDPKFSGSVTKESVTTEVTLNVFKPVLTFKDATVEAGTSVDRDFYTANNYLSEKTVWKCGDILSDDVTMTGEKSELSLTYDPSTFIAPDKGGDTPIKVIVKTNSKASDATFVWEKASDCPDDCTGSPENAQFRIHCLPGLFDITITKTVENENMSDHFIFAVTGPNNYRARVVVAPNNSVTIKSLPTGEYTVQEETWSWAYTSDQPGDKITQNISINNSFTFVNTQKDMTPLHSEAIKENNLNNY